MGLATLFIIGLITIFFIAFIRSFFGKPKIVPALQEYKSTIPQDKRLFKRIIRSKDRRQQEALLEKERKLDIEKAQMAKIAEQQIAEKRKD